MQEASARGSTVQVASGLPHTRPVDGVDEALADDVQVGHDLAVAGIAKAKELVVPAVRYSRYRKYSILIPCKDVQLKWKAAGWTYALQKHKVLTGR